MRRYPQITCTQKSSENQSSASLKLSREELIVAAARWNSVLIDTRVKNKRRARIIHLITLLEQMSDDNQIVTV